MTFTSPVVQLHWNQNNILLVRGNSKLIITAEHVNQLRSVQNFSEFSDYFLTQALINRAARRVFTAWQDKDKELLSKLHQEVLS